MYINIFELPFPVMSLGNFVLREIDPEGDHETYFKYMNDERLNCFLADGIVPKDLEVAKNDLSYWQSLFEKKRSVYWAIALKDSNELIGTIGFNSIFFDFKKAEISYELNADYWGQGIMLKSLHNILEYNDNNMQFVRIQATTLKSNQKSIKLLERGNFFSEGVLRKYGIVNGEHVDYLMYARILD